MTVKDIELTVQNIARLGNYDPEMAHKSQDDLFVHVLKEIAHDNPHSNEAKEKADRSTLASF